MAKSRHEDFAKFFEIPTRETFRELIRNHVGELDQLDFKEEWPAHPSVARHLLGFANSGGGCIVVGMKQENDNSLTAIGLTKLADKADITKGIKKFIPQQLKYEILDFKYEASEYKNISGKSFQVIIIETDNRYIPFIAEAESDKAIRRNGIYVRRGTNTDEANYQELQNIINRRIETEYSTSGEFDLEREFSELRILYGQIEQYKYENPWNDEPDPYLVTNVDYPDENFDEFIGKMIKMKKKRIQATLLGKKST